MNYCDYYLKVLSIYISTRAMSPFDLWYSLGDLGDKDFFIWNPGIDDRSVALFMYPRSWNRTQTPVESIINYKIPGNFTFIYESKKTPPIYITEVML